MARFQAMTPGCSKSSNYKTTDQHERGSTDPVRVFVGEAFSRVFMRNQQRFLSQSLPGVPAIAKYPRPYRRRDIHDLIHRVACGMQGRLPVYGKAIPQSADVVRDLEQFLSQGSRDEPLRTGRAKSASNTLHRQLPPHGNDNRPSHKADQCAIEKQSMGLPLVDTRAEC